MDDNDPGPPTPPQTSTDGDVPSSSDQQECEEEAESGIVRGNKVAQMDSVIEQGKYV